MEIRVDTFESLTKNTITNLTNITIDLYLENETDRKKLLEFAKAINTPKVDWSKVPVDTPIIVTDVWGKKWNRYFADLNVNNKVAYFPDGRTSWSWERDGLLIFSDIDKVELALDSDKEKYTTKVVIPNDLFD